MNTPAHEPEQGIESRLMDVVIRGSTHLTPSPFSALLDEIVLRVIAEV